MSTHSDDAASVEVNRLSVDAADMTWFHEAAVSETTEVFGNVAHRFNFTSSTSWTVAETSLKRSER